MNDRRLLLTRATKILALIGFGFIAYPFVAALLPDTAVDDARRRQWLREIDLAPLAPGELLDIDDWPGGPVAVYRRTAAERDALLHKVPAPRDTALPAGLDERTRSLLPEYFVFMPVDRVRGCRVRHAADDAKRIGIGGFTNPCTGVDYDTAGRSVGAADTSDAENLRVPNQRLIGKFRVQLLPD